MMKAQSAIEFLSTYAFLFIILTIAILLIVFIISSAVTYIPTQCVSYGSINCNYVNEYTNTTFLTSLLTFQFTNAQEVPMNITSFNAGIGQLDYPGVCEPGFLYPGEGTTCIVNISSQSPNVGSTVRGGYTVDAQQCNSAVGSLDAGNCTANVIYTGTYVTDATGTYSLVFSALVAQGPPSNQLLPYNAVNPPFIPANYTMVENGEWQTTVQSNDLGASPRWPPWYGVLDYVSFDYATNSFPKYSNPTGYDPNTDTPMQQFPQSISMLNNDHVASSAPYNSLLSMAYTVINFPANVPNPCLYESPPYFNWEGPDIWFSTFADDMQVYYKPVNSMTWNVLIYQLAPGQYSNWPVGSYGDGESWGLTGGTPQVVNSQWWGGGVVLSPGLYDFAVAWVNANGMGMEALNMSLYYRTNIGPYSIGC